eukprot:TRINITY_DN2486_c0_g1_i8.p2 TRINITY_DN2486_c0_g1~~TRINITY_DN2486_c0_g1_i8.p2  ORF type:complete len:186 (-),score=28.62 TRINITY_DN2486_c0_g1_i8:658-1215(-)
MYYTTPDDEPRRGRVPRSLELGLALFLIVCMTLRLVAPPGSGTVGSEDEFVADLRPPAELRPQTSLRNEVVRLRAQLRQWPPPRVEAALRRVSAKYPTPDQMPLLCELVRESRKTLSTSGYSLVEDVNQQREDQESMLEERRVLLDMLRTSSVAVLTRSVLKAGQELQTCEADRAEGAALSNTMR